MNDHNPFVATYVTNWAVLIILAATYSVTAISIKDYVGFEKIILSLIMVWSMIGMLYVWVNKLGFFGLIPGSLFVIGTIKFNYTIQISAFWIAGFQLAIILIYQLLFKTKKGKEVVKKWLKRKLK